MKFVFCILSSIFAAPVPVANANPDLAEIIKAHTNPAEFAKVHVNPGITDLPLFLSAHSLAPAPGAAGATDGGGQKAGFLGKLAVSGAIAEMTNMVNKNPTPEMKAALANLKNIFKTGQDGAALDSIGSTTGSTTGTKSDGSTSNLTADSTVTSSDSTSDSSSDASDNAADQE